VAGQLARRDQADDVVGGDRLAQFVDEEATVGVAVECQADVGSVAAYC